MNAITPEPLDGGFTGYFYPSLPSTQITARDHVQNGTAKDGDVIITAEQTAGYGRRGRSWSHENGNVYLTLIRHFDQGSKEKLYHYGFLASLSIAAACRECLNGTMAQVKLKWPNDVLVNDAKIAGILLERSEQADASYLLMGVGVNLVTPSGVDQPVAALDQFMSGIVPARAFILAFLRHLSMYEAMLRDKGFATIRQEWLAQAKGQGEPIIARLANGTVLNGTFLDLDAQGALLLQTDEMLKAVTAADIFFTV